MGTLCHKAKHHMKFKGGGKASFDSFTSTVLESPFVKLRHLRNILRLYISHTKLALGLNCVKRLS
jgi:pyruvate/oxaloacetate carboxyltransferase